MDLVYLGDHLFLLVQGSPVSLFHLLVLVILAPRLALSLPWDQLDLLDLVWSHQCFPCSLAIQAPLKNQGSPFDPLLPLHLLVPVGPLFFA